MVLVERSLVKSFHDMPDIGTFIIQPEHLTSEEIEYELRIRQQLITGQRRELAAALREIIVQEQKGEKEVPATGYGVPSEEVELCRNQLPFLANLLDQVTADINTQNTYMSKHLHVEGRLNRIQRIHQLTSGIFEVNEGLSKLYHEFCTKVTGLKKNKGQPSAGKEGDQLPQHSEATGGETGDGIEREEMGAKDQVDEREEIVTGKKVNTETGTIPKVQAKNQDQRTNRMNAKDHKAQNMPPNAFDRMYQLPTQQVPLIEFPPSPERDEDPSLIEMFRQMNPPFRPGRRQVPNDIPEIRLNGKRTEKAHGHQGGYKQNARAQNNPERTFPTPKQVFHTHPT